MFFILTKFRFIFQHKPEVASLLEHKKTLSPHAQAPEKHDPSAEDAALLAQLKQQRDQLETVVAEKIVAAKSPLILRTMAKDSEYPLSARRLALENPNIDPQYFAENLHRILTTNENLSTEDFKLLVSAIKNPLLSPRQMVQVAEFCVETNQPAIALELIANPNAPRRALHILYNSQLLFAEDRSEITEHPNF